MLDDALFVRDDVVPKQVEIGGKKITLYFRALAAAEVRRLDRQASDKTDRQTLLIVASLCEPDGKPAIDAKKAAKLTAQAENAIFSAVLEVNGIAGAEALGNESPPGETSGSGMSSPSA